MLVSNKADYFILFYFLFLYLLAFFSHCTDTAFTECAGDLSNKKLPVNKYVVREDHIKTTTGTMTIMFTSQIMTMTIGIIPK